MAHSHSGKIPMVTATVVTVRSGRRRSAQRFAIARLVLPPVQVPGTFERDLQCRGKAEADDAGEGSEDVVFAVKDHRRAGVGR